MTREWQRAMDAAVREIQAACDRIVERLDRSIVILDRMIERIEQTRRDIGDEQEGFV